MPKSCLNCRLNRRPLRRGVAADCRHERGRAGKAIDRFCRARNDAGGNISPATRDEIATITAAECGDWLAARQDPGLLRRYLTVHRIRAAVQPTVDLFGGGPTALIAPRTRRDADRARRVLAGSGFNIVNPEIEEESK